MTSQGQKMKGKFIEAQRIAKELKAKNPNLKHIEAVKQAWIQMKKEGK